METNRNTYMGIQPYTHIHKLERAVIVMNDRYTKYYNAMRNYLAEKELKYLLSKVKTKASKSTCLSLDADLPCGVVSPLRD